MYYKKLKFPSLVHFEVSSSSSIPWSFRVSVDLDYIFYSKSQNSSMILISSKKLLEPSQTYIKPITLLY